MTYTCTPEDEGKRIDRKLLEFSEDYSRTQWQRAIDDGNVSVNGKTAKANYKLRAGDVIDYEEPTVLEMKVEPVPMDLDIIYEDQDVIVLNKPKGLVVHPGAGTKEPTLVSGLLAHSDSLSGVNGDFRPGIVHRIDKNTSGLLIVAKNDKAHHALAAQLEDRSLSRNYYALVSGVIKEESGTIDAPIGRDPRDRTKMTVTKENSKPAVTQFTVLKRYREYTLVECHLKTGRTHQIRVHMKFIKHPVAGDPEYGIKKDALAESQLLHAHSITFIHPSTKERMTFEAPLPEEFRKVLAYLDEREGAVQ